MTIKDVKPEEYNPYYGNYINKLTSDIDLIEGYKLGKEEVINFFKNIPKTKMDHSYQEGKWSIKEVLQHIIDTERIFIYRAFRIARWDKTGLSGFDQNVYIEPSGASKKTKEQLLSEYSCTRDYSISILTSLSEEDLCQIGISNDDNMSARAAAFTILGHEIWHMDVIKEKYV